MFKLDKPRTLTGALLLALPVTAFAAEQSQTANLTPIDQTHFSYPITLNKDQYLTGKIQSDKANYVLSLRNSKGDLVKIFLTPEISRDEFRFVSPSDTVYTLSYESLENYPKDKAPSIEWSVMDAYSTPVNPAVDTGPTSSALLNAAASSIRDGDDIDSVWNTLIEHGTPLIEPIGENQTRITFLYRGARFGVKILGAPSADHDPMSRLGDTDIWYKSYDVPNTTRLTYQLVPDYPILPEGSRERRISLLATSQQDPNNPLTFSYTNPADRYTDYSILDLTNDHQRQLALMAAKPQGDLAAYTFESQTLSNSRRVWIYIPKGVTVTPDADLNLALFFDGLEYQHKIPTPAILDHLIEHKRIAPTVAVLVDNASRDSRGKELPPNPDFAKMLATELKPWVENTLDHTFDANHTLLSGSSYGGLASMYVAHQYPDVFGQVLSQSGSFWWGENREHSEWLTEHIRRHPEPSLNIYMNAGLFEVGRNDVGILESNRRLVELLNALEYKVEYKEYASGHDYFQWQDKIIEGLEYLLAP